MSTDPRYVFMTLGLPGSGKSFVSEWLAPHMQAVHLRTDDLRVAMFKGDHLDLHTPENKALVNNAFIYAVGRILQSGCASVVMDANHNSYKVRKKTAALARRHNAAPIVIWLDMDIEHAKQRVEARAASGGHKLFDPYVVEKMAKRLERPLPDEQVIQLDGFATAAEQMASFDEQLVRLAPVELR